MLKLITQNRQLLLNLTRKPISVNNDKLMNGLANGTCEMSIYYLTSRLIAIDIIIKDYKVNYF